MAILFVEWRRSSSGAATTGNPRNVQRRSAGLRNTSAVECAIRKHPHLARFECNDASLQAGCRHGPNHLDCHLARRV
ncbi:MAG: hypothetical protein DMF84_13900 [Acidobacteria bacterium]|nr:MAG: hypothetical protein DMF84_13900 [Acidobacteriota bacterium]